MHFPNHRHRIHHHCIHHLRHHHPSPTPLPKAEAEAMLTACQNDLEAKEDEAKVALDDKMQNFAQEINKAFG